MKEYDVAPPSRRHRGRPWVFSGRAFLLLAVVGGVLRTFKAQECRVPHRRTVER